MSMNINKQNLFRKETKPQSDLQQLSTRLTWFINFQLQTVSFYPWFMETSQATKDAHNRYSLAKRSYIKALKKDYQVQKAAILKKREDRKRKQLLT